MAYGVKMNVRAVHKYLRLNSLCWLQITNGGNGNERFIVSAVTRGGRRITTWIDARDVHNCRASWVDKHDQWKFPFDTREQAQAWADMINETYCSQPVRYTGAEV